MKKILIAAACLFALAATSCSDQTAELVDFQQGNLTECTATPSDNVALQYNNNVWAELNKPTQLEVGNLVFSHDGYVSMYGPYWDGFVASACYGNPEVNAGNYLDYQFYSYPGEGANGKQPYIVGYASDYSNNIPACGITCKSGLFAPRSVSIANFVYMVSAITKGDAYCRAFENGDYCVLHIYGLSLANDLRGPVDVYLADYRDGKQEVLTDWKRVDLSALGTVKQVCFQMESTDTGTWGMNTPAYFCLDNFEYVAQ